MYNTKVAKMATILPRSETSEFQVDSPVLWVDLNKIWFHRLFKLLFVSYDVVLSQCLDVLHDNQAI